MSDSTEDVEEATEFQGELEDGDVEERSGADAGLTGYLDTGIKYLDGLIGQKADTGLGGLRRAVKKTRDLVQQAEVRAYERARAELRQEALSPEDREQLRREFVEELRGQDAARRNQLRLGVPDALLGNFEGLGPDFKDWEQRAAELHAQNITWGDSPLVQRVAAAQVQAYRQQAEQAAQSGTVDLSPNGVPDQIRDELIRRTVGQQQAAQSGGQPPGANGLVEEIQRAAKDPDRLGEQGALDLADRLNRELDSLSGGFNPTIGGDR